eukprot:CAMPEP_0196664708 /NCGR_PEP_ID=MMETSP1086-20130531/58060_1 /TAXON_ID=77921 /ORGANISM="Cyanoptyche  gloeocystis , Strain SAG4.97" /LENGTH=626 /DNA_ID=CAMNT_0042001119 /DNA_START=66 /DNA_END=1946 /DNA_ORIENTATION=+
MTSFKPLLDDPVAHIKQVAAEVCQGNVSGTVPLLVVAVAGFVLYLLLGAVFSWMKELPDLPIKELPADIVPKIASPDDKSKFYTQAEIDAIVQRVRSPNGPPDVIECFDPSTFQKLGTLPAMKAPEVQRRIALAKKAQESWAQTSFAQRRQVLRLVAKYIVKYQEDICKVSSRDSGKNMTDAMLGEVFCTLEKIRHMITSGEEYLKPSYRHPGILAIKSCRVEYQPCGVIGIIAPWNYPFHNIYGQVVAALYAGNACVVKISEWTAWSGPYLISFVHNALRASGHSPDLVQLIIGYGDAGAAVVSGGVDKIIFTGSPGNGKRVMAEASKTLTPVVLELGGKDPMIICEDGDLDAATSAATRGSFTNCGQNCINVERVYVQESVHDKFVEKVVKYIKCMRQGPPQLGPADQGSMTMPGQSEAIEKLVEDAVSKGAKCMVGGKRNRTIDGQFFQPTLLTNVDHSMRIVKEEAFGPVMLVMKFKTDEEVIALANGTEYGLGSTVYSTDYKRAERIAKAMHAGMCVINDYGVNYLIQALPFGGVKISGFGRFNGPEGLRGVCNEKAIVTDRFSFMRTKIPGALMYPLPENSNKLIMQAMHLLYGGDIFERIGGLFGLLKEILSIKKPKMD